MLQQVSPLERIGDGFGNDQLVGHVAEAMPFMHFAIDETSLSGNRTGRTPSHNPDHWLAVNNCGPSSRALAYYLSTAGYEVQPLATKDHSHMLLGVEVDGARAHVDPTALQFLDQYGINANNMPGHKLDDISGDLLPAERVLIFRPEDYKDVAEWLATVVRRYWQTKASQLYEAGLMDMSRGGMWRRRQADTSPIADLTKNFMKIYEPSSLKPYDVRPRVDYEDLFKSWSATHRQAG